MAESVYSYIEKGRDKSGACDPHASLVELLDGIILFYHIGALKQLIKVRGLDTAPAVKPRRRFYPLVKLGSSNRFLCSTRLWKAARNVTHSF